MFVILISSCYNADTKEARSIRKQKYYFAINEYEYSMVINGLNGLQNKLIAG